MVAETQQVAEAAGSLGPLGSLGVNGKLFLAQLVNFGVVVFVMWKWVYTPLLKVMDERTKKIEQGLKDADASGAARKAADEASLAIVAEARQKAKGIMDDAAVAAETERAAATTRTRAEVERLVSQGRQQLASDKDKLLAEVKAEVGSLVAMATERVLGEKMDEKKDAAMIAKAIKDVAA